MKKIIVIKGYQMKTLLAIALGGALGSVLRYLLNNAIVGATGAAFPWGILIVNVLGSFVMGLLIGGFALFGAVPQELRAFLTIGILGGFTTFSTFALDSVLLLQRGAPVLAMLYVGGSVGLAILGLYSGMLLMRAVA
jgi:CrcB protein